MSSNIVVCVLFIIFITSPNLQYKKTPPLISKRRSQLRGSTLLYRQTIHSSSTSMLYLCNGRNPVQPTNRSVHSSKGHFIIDDLGIYTSHSLSLKPSNSYFPLSTQSFLIHINLIPINLVWILNVYCTYPKVLCQYLRYKFFSCNIC